jgi:hypothetical protein
MISVKNQLIKVTASISVKITISDFYLLIICISIRRNWPRKAFRAYVIISLLNVIIISKWTEFNLIDLKSSAAALELIIFLIGDFARFFFIARERVIFFLINSFFSLSFWKSLSKFLFELLSFPKFSFFFSVFFSIYFLFLIFFFIFISSSDDFRFLNFDENCGRKLINWIFIFPVISFSHSAVADRIINY